MVITDENIRVSFREKKKTTQEKVIEDYYYPTVYYYYGIDPNKNAIEFEENGKTHILFCSSPKEGYEKIDWVRALDAGMGKYTDYDVDQFRTPAELEEIFKTCTGSCDSGIFQFKKFFEVDEDALYTIRQAGRMIQEYNYVKGAIKVFFKFFNLPMEEDAD
jgi:hypothetical protein